MIHSWINIVPPCQKDAKVYNRTGKPCRKFGRKVPKQSRSGSLDSSQEHPKIPKRTKEIFLGYGGDKEFIIKSYVDARFYTVRMTLSLNLDAY